MNKDFEKELHKILTIHKIGILEEINSCVRGLNIDFVKLEEDLKMLLIENKQIKEKNK